MMRDAESALVIGGESNGDMGQFRGSEPTPEAAAPLRTMALRKLEGCSSWVIAAEFSVSARNVDRKLELIREIWGVSQDELP
jgi:hypothetical protein